MARTKASDTTTRNQTGRSRAGSKGGRTTAARLGREFYQRIGKKGGSSRGRKSESQQP